MDSSKVLALTTLVDASLIEMFQFLLCWLGWPEQVSVLLNRMAELLMFLATVMESNQP
jgi:hypothetical protein